jgi:uncharacterized protein YndB with AHSA1/START domain
MSKNTRIFSCTPEDVFAVLSDGWLYGEWVVGSVRIRDVDHEWPAEGSRIHHSVGVWPLLIDDESVVLTSKPPALLKLRVKAWPAGEGVVTLHCEPHSDGTLVTIEEDATNGPGALVPKQLRDPVLTWRNTETLRRLAYLAEGRAREKAR